MQRYTRRELTISQVGFALGSYDWVPVAKITTGTGNVPQDVLPDLLEPYVKSRELLVREGADETEYKLSTLGVRNFRKAVGRKPF